MPKMIAAVAVLFVAAFLSSSSDAQTRRKPVSKAPAKAVQKPVELSSGAVRTPSGLTYMILKKGTGRLPKAGETVIYHYTGTFTNGVKFDSSRERGQPFAFKLGAGQVIKGTEEVTAKLRVGDHAIMIFPPNLAYGEKGTGNGVIPPNSTLVFTVEILDIKETTLSDLLFKLNDTGGSSAMISRYRELKSTNFDNSKVYANEAELNTLGYLLLRSKKADDAVAIFKLNVEEYPRSANVYDSLGEAYVATGQKQLAIENYQKALEIDPKFDSSVKALEKLRSSP
jgi:FKBP-type peptidyl-prolyl cis-trans isomerase